MSLEFINQNSQQVTKKKQGGVQYIKEKNSDMIREEQYDEDQDENSENEYKQKHYYINSNGGDDKFGKTNSNLEENYSLDSL